MQSVEGFEMVAGGGGVMNNKRNGGGEYNNRQTVCKYVDIPNYNDGGEDDGCFYLGVMLVIVILPLLYFKYCNDHGSFPFFVNNNPTAGGGERGDKRVVGYVARASGMPDSDPPSEQKESSEKSKTASEAEPTESGGGLGGSKTDASTVMPPNDDSEVSSVPAEKNGSNCDVGKAAESDADDQHNIHSDKLIMPAKLVRSKKGELTLEAPRNKKQVIHTFSLTNRSATKRMGWIVKTNAPERLSINPAKGVCAPSEDASITVSLKTGIPAPAAADDDRSNNKSFEINNLAMAVAGEEKEPFSILPKPNSTATTTAAAAKSNNIIPKKDRFTIIWFQAPDPVPSPSPSPGAIEKEVEKEEAESRQLKDSEFNFDWLRHPDLIQQKRKSVLVHYKLVEETTAE